MFHQCHKISVIILHTPTYHLNFRPLRLNCTISLYFFQGVLIERFLQGKCMFVDIACRPKTGFTTRFIHDRNVFNKFSKTSPNSIVDIALYSYIIKFKTYIVFIQYFILRWLHLKTIWTFTQDIQVCCADFLKNQRLLLYLMWKSCVGKVGQSKFGKYCELVKNS